MLNMSLLQPRNLLTIIAIALVVHMIVSPMHSILDGDDGAN